MSDSETVQPEVRRKRSSRRHQQSKQSSSPSWAARNGLDLAFTLFLALAILMIFNPLTNNPVVEKIQSPLAIWLFWQGGIVILGGVLLVMVVMLGSLRLRQRINHHRRWWAGICPMCGGANLSRVHRTRFDRLLGSMGIPVRRYVCRQCHWQGRRIDESRV